MTATVKDVMTSRVVALRKDAEFKDIARVLRGCRVSACPVIDGDDHLVGVVSEADLLRKLTDPALPTGLIRLGWRLSEQTNGTALTAEQLMTSPAIAIHPWASVSEAATQMQERQVKRLPVVDAHGKLVGIVTRSDVLSVFERPDGDIRDEVAKVILDEEFGLDPECIDIAVRSGVVTIAGQVKETATALYLLARIRHTEGVVGVRNRLTYPRPSDDG
jgi:CBS domain-containing protein